MSDSFESDRQLVDRVIESTCRKLMEGIPAGLLNSDGGNYSSAAATAATYGPSVLKSAAEIMQAFKDAEGIVKDSKPRSLRNAFLVVPPETFHHMKLDPVFLETPEIEGPIRFRTFMDYGVRMPVYRSMLLRDADWPIEPKYKPRPLPEPVQKVPAWQYVVAVAAGVLILSMMFSAVSAL